MPSACGDKAKTTPCPGGGFDNPLEGIYVSSGVATSDDMRIRDLAVKAYEKQDEKDQIDDLVKVKEGEIYIRTMMISRDTDCSTNMIGASDSDVFNIHFQPNDERLAEDVWSRRSNKNEIPIQRLVANVLLYLSSSDGQCDRPDTSLFKLSESETHLGRKRKLEHKIALGNLPDEYIVGQHVEFDGKHADLPVLGGVESDRSVRPHWRRGHWRRVWLGRHDEPETRHLKPRWIKPKLVNEDRGPAPESVTYHVKEQA
jgi:hypothetical protein